MNFLRSTIFKILIVLVVVIVGCLICFRLLPNDSEGLIILFILSILAMPVVIIIAGKQYAPKPYNYCAIWSGLLFVGICVLNAIGQDDKNLLVVFFGIDVIYVELLYMESIRAYLITDDGITFVGYVVRVVLGVIYGGILDLIVYIVRRNRKAIR